MDVQHFHSLDLSLYITSSRRTSLILPELSCLDLICDPNSCTPPPQLLLQCTLIADLLASVCSSLGAK